MYLGRFVHTETGKLIMSILLGFGLASLFRTVCKDKKCFVFHAPSLEEIKDKTFHFDDKCYQFEPVSSKCDKTKRILSFAQVG